MLPEEVKNPTDTSMALLDDADDQAVLAFLRKQNETKTVVRHDTIKFKDSEKKIEGLTRGNYYIESYDGTKPDGERKTFRDIGPNPRTVLLHRAYTYSYYKEGVGLKAFTTDIQNFTENDFVELYSRKDGEKMQLEFASNYPQMKRYLEEKYVTKDEEGKTEKLMTFQNVLYVLFEGKVYRMFVSNASTAGVAKGELGGDFKNPQPLSLLSYIETTKRENGGALCEFICQLGSVFKDDVEQPYYIRTFENVGKNEESLGMAVKEAKTILMDVMKQQKDISERKNIGSLSREVFGIAAPQPGGHMEGRVKVEDLPF